MSGVVEEAAGAAASAVAKPFLPWLILGAVLLFAGLMSGAYYEGWTMRGDREAAKELKAQQQMRAEIDAQRARGDQLAGDLEKEKSNVKTVTVEVVKEVPKVVTVYKDRPNAPAKPLPPAIFTWGFVGLYDRALRPDLPSSASEFASSAGGSSIVRSPATSADILNNHAVNAGQYAECRAQLNKLIDWVQGLPKQH